MGPSRRFRSARRNYFRVDLHTSVQILTGFVTLGIFLSEALIKERTIQNPSQPIQTTITSDVNSTITVIHRDHVSESTPFEKQLPTPRQDKLVSENKNFLAITVKGVAIDPTRFKSSTSIVESKSLKSRNYTLNDTRQGCARMCSNYSMTNPKLVKSIRQNTKTAAALKPAQNSTASTDKLIHYTNTSMYKQDSIFLGVQMTKRNKHLFRDDNITTLSYMLYRLVKTHKITSIIDIPCSKSMKWMPEVLVRLEFEIPRFHYKCVVLDDKSLAEAVIRYEDLTSATVVKDGTIWASKLPKTDLAFLWYSLGYFSSRESWQILKALFKSSTKFVLVPNFPELQVNPGSPSKNREINVRRAPYRFNEPLRVINNMSSNPKVPKQLLLYSLDGVGNSM